MKEKSKLGLRIFALIFSLVVIVGGFTAYALLTKNDKKFSLEDAYKCTNATTEMYESGETEVKSEKTDSAMVQASQLVDCSEFNLLYKVCSEDIYSIFGIYLSREVCSGGFSCNTFYKCPINDSYTDSDGNLVSNVFTLSIYYDLTNTSFVIHYWVYDSDINKLMQEFIMEFSYDDDNYLFKFYVIVNSDSSDSYTTIKSYNFNYVKFIFDENEILDFESKSVNFRYKNVNGYPALTSTISALDTEKINYVLIQDYDYETKFVTAKAGGSGSTTVMIIDGTTCATEELSNAEILQVYQNIKDEFANVRLLSGSEIEYIDSNGLYDLIDKINKDYNE